MEKIQHAQVANKYKKKKNAKECASHFPTKHSRMLQSTHNGERSVHYFIVEFKESAVLGPSLKINRLC